MAGSGEPAAGSGVRRRVLTASVLIPPVTLGVLTLPTFLVAIAFGIFVVAAAWEWAGLAGWRSVRSRGAYAAAAAISMTLLYPWLDHAGQTRIVLAGGLCWWLWALYWVVRVERGSSASGFRSGGIRAAVGLLVLLPAWSALVDMHGHPEWGPKWVLYLLVLIWCADVGAYFAGRRWGTHLLAPRISPGKTWEGVAGAIGLVAVASLGLLALSGMAGYLLVLALTLATVPVSVLGDLTESQWKRLAGVKDSGMLIPGHGGVLDRIDSLTAAAPFFVLGASSMGTLH